MLSTGGNNKMNNPAVERLMVGIDELDANLMWPRRQANNDQGRAARICPMPRRVVNGDMNVPDARGNFERRRTEHRNDPEILGPILDDNSSLGEPFGNWGINNYLSRRFTDERHDTRRAKEVASALRKNRGRA